MRLRRGALSLLLLFTSPNLTRVSAGRSPRWVVDDSGCVTPDGAGAGFCTVQEQCQTVQDLIAPFKHDDEKTGSILRRYACGVDKSRRYKVCCPYKSSDADDATDADDHSNHRNVKLLPKDCGPVRAWGIFNGNESYLSEFVWPALLKYQKSGDPYLCGGTLINDRYILTAARCTKHKFRLIGVRLGEYDVRRVQDCTWEYSAGNMIETCAPPVQDFAITIDDATVHPGYNPKTHQNDIALLRLRRRVDTGVTSVASICLPITGREKKLKSTKYTTIGWGATEYGISTPVLLKVLTETVSASRCQGFYKDFEDKARRQICTLGVQGQDSCAGDYGGPLMGYYDDGDKLRTIQYGIVAIRPSICQGDGAPVVYINVTRYVGWVLDNIEP